MKKFFYLMVGLFCMCLSSIAISQTPNTICLKPNQAIAAPSKNSAILAWTITPATSYSVQYKIKNAATWTTVSVTNPPYTLSGLATCTEYVYKVKSVCSPTSSSLFSNEVTFKTTGCPTCNVPIVLSTIPNPTGGQLKWRNTGATSYSIQYKSATQTVWTTINSIPDTTYTLTNLQNCKAYAWRVKGVCSATFQSNYSAQFPLVTTGCTTGCTAPVAVNAYGTANGFVATWSFSGANSYTLEYKKPSDSIWTSIPGITTVNYTVANLPTCTEYLWRVKGICVGIASAYSATKAVKTGGCPAPCLTPVQTFASNIDTTKAILNWFSTTAAIPVLSNILYKMNGGPWVAINNVTSPYIFTGLTPCATYEWKVQTVCNNTSTSAFSAVSSFITKGCIVTPPCFAPTALASTVSDSSATITWVGAAPLHQLAYRVAGSSAAMTIVSNAVSPMTITGLLPCKEYEYKIYAICVTGTVGAVSVIKTFKTTGCAPAPCAAPVQIYATVLDSSKAVLQWFSNAPTTPPVATLYNVQYKTGNGAWVIVNNVSSPFTLIGLSACKTYEWKVQTVCSAISVSAFSNASSFTTPGCPIVTPCIAPTILLATAAQNVATLTWSGGTVGTNTTLLYKLVGAAAWTSVPNATSPYTITGLTPCTEYRWKIAQICTNATTTINVSSQEKTFITTCPQPCLAPTALLALADSTSATLSWLGTAAKYNVWYKTGANANWTILNNVNSPKTITGLTKCAAYEWKVQSVCDSLNTPSSVSGYVASQFSTTGCTTITNCVAPTALTVTAISPQSAVLSWTSSAILFNLQYRIVGTATWITKTGVTKPYTLAPLDACKDYEYKVAALCVPGTVPSAYSTTKIFATTCVTNCAAPTLLPATVTSSTAVLSWIGSTATSYNLVYKAGAATTFTTITNVTSPYTLGNLASCKGHEYKIQAVCNGTVVSSVIAGFQTSGCPIAPTTYCPMIGQSTLNGWIQSVKINAFVSTTGNNLGYFAAPIQSVSVNAGASVTLVMTPSYLALNPNTPMLPQAWRGWVDFNRDGDFSDAGEVIFTTTNTSSAAVTKSFVVPTNVTSGETRMRIAMRVITSVTTVPTVPENCISFDNGEVEDYTILMFSATPNTFISNNTVIASASVYPNPGTDNVTVQLLSKQNIDAQISITDLSGKCVHASNQSVTEGFNALNINDLGNLSQGMYIISVRSNEGILTTQRWVKE